MQQQHIVSYRIASTTTITITITITTIQQNSNTAIQQYNNTTRHYTIPLRITQEQRDDCGSSCSLLLYQHGRSIDPILSD